MGPGLPYKSLKVTLEVSDDTTRRFDMGRITVRVPGGLELVRREFGARSRG